MAKASLRLLPDSRGIIAEPDGVVYRGNTQSDSAIESFAIGRLGGGQFQIAFSDRHSLHHSAAAN